MKEKRENEREEKSRSQNENESNAIQGNMECERHPFGSKYLGPANGTDPYKVEFESAKRNSKDGVLRVEMRFPGERGGGK